MRHAVAQQGPQKGARHPAWAYQAVPRQAQAGAKRCGKSGTEVVLPVGGNGDVHRHHQRAEPGPGNTVHQRVDAGLVSGNVCLEPGAGTLLRDFFHPDQRGAAHDRHDAGLARRPGKRQVAPVARQGGDAHGGDAERAGVALPEQFHRLGALRNVAQDAGGESVFVEDRAVVAQRGIVFGAPACIRRWAAATAGARPPRNRAAPEGRARRGEAWGRRRALRRMPW